jgi:murein DD-endopeptidase MepM/ murein hydrolase activator NlpD
MTFENKANLPEKLLKPYNAADIEESIYKTWEQSGFFNPDVCIERGITDPDAESFSIVLPPPNVTGTLHTGHAFMLVIQDIMVRFHRMRGKKTLWLPGTDHAAIATQSVVEKELEKEKIKKTDLGREEFLNRVNKFAQDSHDTIVGQVRKMGSSVDWSREAFTLDEKRGLAVNTAFKQMYDDDFLIKTTLSSDNLSDFLDQVQYTQSFQTKVYQLVQKIKDLKAKLEQQERELQAQVNKLKELKDELEITQKSLETQRQQKQVLLNQTRGLEQNYQKLLAVSQKEEAQIQKEIENLDSEIRKKLGNKTLSASKGVLAWPIDGILTQKYGNTGFTSLGYTFHNGIDVAAPAGKPIYAAADGEVLYTDSSDTAYGNWVAIKHAISTKSGNREIVTLYAHMRSFKVKPGQSVKQGDLVGYEGNTGNTTKKLYGPERGYHIHFGVYDAEGFGVNPGQYSKIYGPYKVPYGYTYNPLDFL